MEEAPKKERKPMKKGLKIFLIVLSSVFAFIFTVVGGFLIFAAATELKVADKEKVLLYGEGSKELRTTETIKVMSWNVGYCGLSEENDFFMDGGTKVRATSLQKVQANAAAIKEEIATNNPDVVLLQEVDYNSSRSYKYNQVNYFRKELNKSVYESSFALNYKAGYVPYPIPTIGKVESGILSFSKYDVTDATRVALPCPFSWPLSMVNLKRCLLVNRVPIIDNGKELVIVNLHLEAYDEGEGKIAQTKMLKNFIESEYNKGNYVIAGGDFNQSFSQDDISAYPRYGNNWSSPIIDTSMFDAFATFYNDRTHPTCRLLNKPYKGANPDTFQYYMLDGFICTKNLSVTVETLDLHFVNSDHNPVMLTVNFI